MKKLITIATVVSLLMPFSVYAEDSQNQVQEAQQTIDQLKQQLQTTVQQIIDKQENVNALQERYNQSVFDLDQTQQSIDYNEKKLESRLDHSRQRLVAIQTSNEAYDILQILLSSESVGDFLNRLLIISELQHAANRKIEEANELQAELAQLKTDQETLMRSIQEQQTQLDRELAQLELDRNSLVQSLSDNEALLETLQEDAANQLLEQIALVSTQNELVSNDNSESDTSQQELRHDTNANQNSVIVVVDNSQSQNNASDNVSNTEITASDTSIADSVVNQLLGSPKLYTLAQFIPKGVVNWNQMKFTYYSQSVLPGYNLQIPGRHVNTDGYVADKDGYIVIANDKPKGTIINTPFGYQGKVYDRGTSGNHYDIYIR